MRRSIQKLSSLFLPILLFLTISTLFWQKIDDYNSSISNRYYAIEMEANNEKIPTDGCGTGLHILNNRVQSVLVLLFSCAFLGLIFRKSFSRLSSYFFIISGLLFVWGFNLLVGFYGFEIYSFPFISEETGFYTRRVTVPDFFLALCYLLLVITLTLKFGFFIKHKLFAQNQLR